MDLKPVGIFKGMPPAELKKISKQMREIRHPKGAEIMIRGEGGVGFLVILTGEAEVETGDGRRRTLGPGDHFGEIALLRGTPRSATVRAVSPSRLLRLESGDFLAAVTQHAISSDRLESIVAARLDSSAAIRGQAPDRR